MLVGRRRSASDAAVLRRCATVACGAKNRATDEMGEAAGPAIYGAEILGRHGTTGRGRSGLSGVGAEVESVPAMAKGRGSP